MPGNSNYKDLWRSFNDAGVRYLAAGGYAVMKYTVEDPIAPDIIRQVGVDYNRIDVIPHLPGRASHLAPRSDRAQASRSI